MDLIRPTVSWEASVLSTTPYKVNAASGSITSDVDYIVENTDNSYITYNGINYYDDDTFRGVYGITDYTESGSSDVYTDHQYITKLQAVNPNDPGYEQLTVGYFIVDYIGYIYEILEINYGGDSMTVRVRDLIKDPNGYGVYQGRNCYVYESLTKAATVAQAKLNRLDESAEDFVRSLGIEEDDFLTFINAGMLNVPSFTVEVDTTITIGPGNAALFDNAGYEGFLNRYVIASDNFTLTEELLQYVVVDYNSGSPQYDLIDDFTLINGSSIVLVYSVFKKGGDVNYVNWGETGYGLANKSFNRTLGTENIRVEKGLKIFNDGGKGFRVSSGIVWIGNERKVLSELHSASSNTTYRWTHEAADWLELNVTEYNNLTYQGDIYTAALSDNQYGINWIYRSIDDSDEIRILLGVDSYDTMWEADKAQPPTDLPNTAHIYPDIIKDHSILVGKIIIKKGESQPTAIHSVSDIPFSKSTNIHEGLQFNTGYVPDPSEEIEGAVHWNHTANTIDIHTGYDTVLQAGQEIHIKVYNDTANLIPNGTAVYPTGAFNNFPTIGLAMTSTHETIDIDYGVTTVDIPAGEYGFVTWFGKVRGLDTSAFNVGDRLWISGTNPGEITNIRPSFPDYSIQVGVCFIASPTDGEIFVTGRDAVTDTFQNFWNGTIRESFSFKVTSDGSTITGSLTPKNGHQNLTMIFSDGFTMLQTTPAATVTLTPGTATIPQLNYIYIPQDTKVLTTSTSYWPTIEHIKLATVIVKDAATTQSDGALMNHNWRDHVQDTTDNEGHLPHIGERIRVLDADWNTGVEASLVGTPVNMYVDTTSGTVYQMHLHSFEAMSMSTGDDIHVVNDPTVPYRTTHNLNDITVDSLGNTISNKWFSIVIWGVANETGEISHLMCNLPSGSYLTETDAVNDVQGYSNYTIPRMFRGTGFLIARFTVRKQSGQFTYNPSVGYQDLRGFVPNSTAGSGAGSSGITTFLGLVDTPNSYISQANKVASVNGTESALEFTSIRYTNTTPMPEDVGGAEAGSTFSNKTLQEMFTTILYPYQYPSFLTFSIQGQTNPLEVGDSILSNRTFIWTTENPSNILTNSINIYDVTNATTLISGTANDGTQAVTMSAITKTTADSHVFQIEGTNSKAESFSKNYTVNWRWRLYYGESTSTSLNEAGVEGLRVSELDTTFVGTYVYGEGGYKYIAYPSSWGTATKFTDTSTGLSVPFEPYSSLSITNTYGVTTTYKVHRSTNILGSAINIAIE